MSEFIYSEQKHEPLYPSVWVDMTTYAHFVGRTPFVGRVNSWLAKFTSWRLGRVNGRRRIFRVAP